MIYIPFVRDSQDFVNASLILKTTATDTSFTFLHDNQYNEYGFDTLKTGVWSARNVFHILTNLDRSIFGRTTYKILDNRIFGGDTALQPVATISGATLTPSGKTSQILPVTECIAVRFCADYRAFRVASTQADDIICNSPTYSQYCTTYWVDNGLPSGTGGTGGGAVGSGGTGGGTGWTGNPCPPGGGGVQPRISVNEPCTGGGTGWVPVPIRYPMVSVNSIIDSLKNPCLVSAKNKITDSTIKTFVTNLFYQNFNTTDVHIKFKEDTTIQDAGGNPQWAQSGAIVSAQTWLILLNPNYYNGHYSITSSQEFAAQTILHEIIHSFIFLYKDKLGITRLNEFNAHKEMFNNWIIRMRDVLKRAFPAISNQEATALALTGLDDVLEMEYNAQGEVVAYSSAMNQFAIANYGLSISQADNLITGFLFGTKGTKCN
jgi:hypothetical protein